jgi:hypothetical protein
MPVLQRGQSRRGQRRWLGAVALVSGVALALIVTALLPRQAGALPGIRSDLPHTIRRTDNANLSSPVYPPLASVVRPELDHYPSCRFGVTVGGDVTSYDVSSLNVGWYLDWGTSVAPSQPGGAEYFQMVRLAQVGSSFTFQPATSTLYAVIDANPGAVWLIGNEQDRRIYQDDLEPEIYARAYHHLYGLIKGRDPSAQIGIGGVVQPTPLRFQYLDLVWDTYMQEYGTAMPVDIWNVHSFILQEISPDHPQLDQPGYENWGAGIPRGTQFDNVMEGALYRYSQVVDLAVFRQRIIEFRQWMAAKGECDKPLIVTEYGVLLYEDFYDENGQQFPAERVGPFMQGTFDFFRTYTDTSIGYPADGYRLVQRWAWFSVDGDPWDWGGSLFDPDTHALRAIGEYFRDYTSALTPTVDVLAARAFAEPAAIMYGGAPVTATLKALVSNAGDVATTRPITVTFYDGPLGQGGASAIGEPQVITHSLQGCADHAVVSVTWKGLDVGGHPFSIQVQVEDEDVNLTNNVAEGVVLVATERMLLPLVLRS